VELGLRSSMFLLTAGTAWARVEAQKHYPSDVLAGAALGHFLGSFLNDIFIGPGKHFEINAGVDPSAKAVDVGFTFHH
jgi:membrane-associated phospholipid phosphatase